MIVIGDVIFEVFLCVFLVNFGVETCLGKL